MMAFYRIEPEHRQAQLYIGGEWRAADETIEVTDLPTEEY